jgi:hypothetical protein
VVAWLKTLRNRTPDQLLVSLALVGFLWVVGRDIHRTLYLVSSPTGVLRRIEVIETQLNATAKNTKEMTADLKAGVKDWRATTTAQLDFVQGALPGLVGQLQNNLDYLSLAVNQHLVPTIDKLGGAADAAAGSANEVTATLNDHVNPVLDQATGSLARFNALMDSKDLNQALGHAYGALASVDTVTSEMATVSTLTRKRLKPLLDPDPCQGRKCLWIKTWNGARVLLNLSGPAVNLDRLVTGAPY